MLFSLKKSILLIPARKKEDRIRILNNHLWLLVFLPPSPTGTISRQTAASTSRMFVHLLWGCNINSQEWTLLENVSLSPKMQKGSNLIPQSVKLQEHSALSEKMTKSLTQSPCHRSPVSDTEALAAARGWWANVGAGLHKKTQLFFPAPAANADVQQSESD